MRLPFKLVVFVGMAIFFASAAIAQPAPTNSRDVTDKVDIHSLLGGPQSLAAPLTPGERAQAESDALGASSDGVLNLARSHYFDFQRDNNAENQALARALLARRRQSNLALERDNALEEMRRGFFCAACRRTRSQIEAAGENWQEHLNANSQGRPVSATPQELAEKQREFDDKISSAKHDEYQATQEANAAQQAKAEAAREVINSYVLWKQALLSEDEGRAKAWDKAVASYKERFDSDKRELQSLDAAISRARTTELRPDSIRDLEDQRESCQARIRIMVNDVQEDYLRRSMQETLFEQRMSSGRKQLEGFVSDVGGPPLDVVSDFTTLPSVSTPCLTCPNGASNNVRIPGSPYSITTAGGGPGLNASLGLFKASLRISGDWLRNALHVEVMLGVDTPYGPLQGGIRQTTTWGPDATTTTVAPASNVPKLPNAFPDPLDLLRGEKGDKKR